MTPKGCMPAPWTISSGRFLKARRGLDLGDQADPGRVALGQLSLEPRDVVGPLDERVADQIRVRSNRVQGGEVRRGQRIEAELRLRKVEPLVDAQVLALLASIGHSKEQPVLEPPLDDRAEPPSLTQTSISLVRAGRWRRATSTRTGAPIPNRREPAGSSSARVRSRWMRASCATVVDEIRDLGPQRSKQTRQDRPVSAAALADVRGDRRPCGRVVVGAVDPGDVHAGRRRG